ncbi:Ig-like domain-containing protein [Streptomyces cocklensis]|uniref:Chap protein n=1 Tax=Actinacidiphila cocklensis TaxID=887465 RepID=A0A9W4GPL3_9ACTN|nr:Ig-like domain-containing protein [Actinacidiphila cocklensis]MDD1058494.1 Ig-like domain-containing protein [Actinacidiphila cocklensis]CAG6390654.1 putative Chap protein [Actinacidiphila cocklensis]
MSTRLFHRWRGRRGPTGLALAAVTAALLCVAPAAHATSTVGGPITGAEMITRAQSWVTDKVPYDQSAWAPDPQGTEYREDCSGFVSMAWHLSRSLIVTDPAPYDFTNVNGTPNSAYDTGIGSFSNLQQGDAMAYPHEHIWLFDKWTNKSTGTFTYYAESNSRQPTHGPTSANIHSSSLEGWPTSGYVGLRYKKITSTVPAGFGIRINGITSGSTVTGTVQLTATASQEGIVEYVNYEIAGPEKLEIRAPGGPTYPATLDTAKVPNGSYTVSVSALLTDGSTRTFSATPFTVANKGNGRFTTAREADGRIRDFTLSTTDNSVWTTAQNSPNGTWPQTWAQVGTSARDITATAEADGRIVLVATSLTDDSVWSTEETAPDSGVMEAGWVRIGGAAKSRPTLAREADGRVVVFDQDPTDGSIWMDEETAVNSGSYAPGWEKVGDAALDVTVSNEADGRMAVFARNVVDASVWYVEETGAGTGTFSPDWAQVGGPAKNRPSLGREGDGRIVVVAQDPNDSSVWTTKETAPGSAAFDSGWTQVGGAANDLSVGNEGEQPTTSGPARGRIVIAARNPQDNSVWYVEETADNSGAFASGWTKMGGPSYIVPMLSNEADGRLIAFAQDPTTYAYWGDDETAPNSAAFAPGWVRIST